MLQIPRSSRQPPREAWTSERLVRERALALGAAIDISTRLSYTSHLQSYLTFCKLHSFDIESTADTLSFYVVFMAQHISPRSIPAYLSGICNQLEPHFPHVRATRRSALVTRTLAGCNRLYNSPISRRDALSLDDLEFTIRHYPNPTHDDRLFLALITAGFFGLHRLGELVCSDNGALRSHRKTIRRSSVEFLDTAYSYLLPTHKADRFFEGNRGYPDDRIQAIGRWSSDAFKQYIRKNPVLLQALIHARRAAEGTGA
ncbi:hypothetical protein OF83DRAFT_1064174 [Amylostereum chailletii]|nr:hypothetical protein OF83DRAFT_1064174 [Amylostereum chailletii]